MDIRKKIKEMECQFSDLGKRNFRTHDRKHHDSFEPDIHLEGSSLVYSVGEGSETRKAVECITARKVSDPIDRLMNNNEGKPEQVDNRRSTRGNVWAANVYQALDREIYAEEADHLTIRGEKGEEVIEADPVKGTVEAYNILRRELEPRESFTYGVYQSLDSISGRLHDYELEITDEYELEIL